MAIGLVTLSGVQSVVRLIDCSVDLFDFAFKESDIADKICL